jgi:hypothetical protein
MHVCNVFDGTYLPNLVDHQKSFEYGDPELEPYYTADIGPTLPLTWPNLLTVILYLHLLVLCAAR